MIRRRRAHQITGEVGFICARCGRDLPETEFFRSSAYTHGVVSTCKVCTRLRRYGITAVQFDEILKTQGDVCALCLRPSSNWNVDHDHDTGLVRGILCGRCNNGLGFFDDGVDGLRRAIRYLESRV